MKTKSFKLGLLLPTFFVFLFSISANAQMGGPGDKSPEEMAESKAKRMKENLQLTDDQYNQVYSVLIEEMKTAAAEREQFRSKTKEERDQMREKHRNSTRERMKGILTEDQMKKFETMHDSNMGKRSKRNRGM